MEEGARKLKCGNCGGDTFSMFCTGKDHHSPDKLIAECSKCKSTTDISVTKPELNLTFGERSEGVLCYMG